MLNLVFLLILDRFFILFLLAHPFLFKTSFSLFLFFLRSCLYLLLLLLFLQFHKFCCYFDTLFFILMLLFLFKPEYISMFVVVLFFRTNMEVKQQFIELSHKNALKVINSTCSVHIRTNELIVKNELIAITKTTYNNNNKKIYNTLI